MAKRTVLLVDDEPLILQYVALMIRRLGYEVEVAASGPEAIARARERAFHGAVVDLRLQGMDGLQTVAELRRLQPEMAAVISSGALTQEVVERAQGAGARTLEKPFGVAALGKLLGELVG